MKKRLFVALVVLVFGYIQCNRPAYSTGAFKARVLASFCAFHIVEILDPAYYDQGTDWKDAKGNILEHVFTVKNHCEFAAAQLKVGDEFKCRFKTADSEQQCMVCMGFMETPALKKNIEVLR